MGRMTIAAVDPEFRSALVAACASFGVSAGASWIERMWGHLCLVREANTRFNLTRVTDARRAAVEHYADSLTLVRWRTERGVVIRHALDVGTGGGWPAVPLAIAWPDVRWTAIDSTGKKARFVAEAATTLGIGNLAVRQARARELAGKAGPFDMIACRAVGKLAELVAETHRLLAPGGLLVCCKTPQMSADERRDGDRAAAAVRLKPTPDFAVDLTLDDETWRRLIVMYQRPKGRPA